MENQLIQEQEGFKCCICKKWSLGWGDKKQWGNNPQPIKEKGQCCDLCNKTVVLAERLRRIYEKEAKK